MRSRAQSLVCCSPDWGINWLLAMLPPSSLPRQQEVTFDLRVFAVAALATVVAGTVTGLAPALQLVRGTISQAFQDGGKGPLRVPGGSASALC